MSQKNSQSYIGFPPPLLGDTPLRLPVVHETEGWLALEKPAGVGLREYPWDKGVPDLDGALNRQLQAGKPELLRHNASIFGSVHYLDPVISGVALFAKNRPALAELRNAYGSGGLTFRFIFVAPGNAAFAVGHESTVDAPLLPHNTKPKMIPSTAKGKKSCTHFRRIEETDAGWALWEASADYLRPHQIRAHAAVLGIPAMGDGLYGGAAAPLLRDLLPGKRGPGVQLPVFEGVALHLAGIRFNEVAGFEPLTLEAGLPRHFRILLQRMHLSSQPQSPSPGESR